MCIIVAKNKGFELPKKEILKNCFDNNSDGAGFMYTLNNKVIIDKGYMKFEDLWKRLQNLQNEIDIKNTPIVLHFRIGTSGNFDASCTHPFSLTNKDNKLKELDAIANIGIAHNGIISSYADAKSELSDTQLFIKKFLFPLYKIDKNFYNNKDIQDIIEKVTSSKFAILTNKNELITIGNFIEKDGILYSNYSFENYTEYNYCWKSKTYKIGNTYDDHYDDYYDDYTKYTVDDILPLQDSEIAQNDDGEIFINYDYRKIGYLATDYFDRLFLIHDETGEIELLSDFVTIYNIDELENVEATKSEVQ